MFRRPGPRVKFRELLADGLARDRKLGLNDIPRKVNRFIGAALAWAFLQTTITANQVTLLMLLLYYAGLIIVALGDFRTALIGFALVFFGDTLDLADGIVGRRNIADGLRKNTKDRFRVVLLAGYHHEGTPGLVLFALAVHSLLNGGATPVFILGALAALFETKTFHLFRLRDWIILRSDLTEQYKGVRETKNIFAESAGKQKLLKLASFPLKYLILIGLAALLFRQLDAALVFYGIYVPLRFLAFFAYNYLQFKRIEDSRPDRK